MPDFGASIIQQAQDIFLDGLEVGQRPEAKSILRFLACLVNTNVISQVEMVRFLQLLVDQAHLAFEESESDEKVPNVWQPKADFMVHSVLVSLVWLASGSGSALCPEMESLVNSIGLFMDRRSSDIPPSVLLFGYDGGLKERELDYLTCVWYAVKDVHAQGSWKKLAHLHRFSTHFTETLASSTNQHTLSCTPMLKIEVPAANIDEMSARISSSFPRRRRLILLGKEHTEGERSPIERVIGEEFVVDTLHFYNSIRKECSERLARLPLGYRHEAFLAEVMFEQMLQLPKAESKPIFYYATMIDLCKLLPEFPRAMAGCVRELFGKLEALDVECRLRLSEWLAYHLSNFNFQWPWERWAHVLQQPNNSVQRMFLEDIISRLVRLSYHEKIQKSLPEAFLCLLPPKPIPVCMYLKQDPQEDEVEDPFMKLAAEFHSMVREKRTDEDVNGWVQESVVASIGASKTLDVVLQVLLMVGSKSFTHTLTALERYIRVLRELVSDEEQEMVAINSVSYVWTNSPQRTIMILNRLHGLRLVRGVSILNWAFSRADLFLQEHLWEIVYNGTNKEVARAHDASEELLAARASRSAMESGDEGEEEKEGAIQDLEKALHEAKETEKQTLLCLFQNFQKALDPMFEGGGSNTPIATYLLQHLRAFGRRFRLSATPLSGILRSQFAGSSVRVREEAFSGLFCTT